ncbi:unnamed protein product, partial [marine sediment metagenome]
LEKAIGSWSAVHEAGVRCTLELRGQLGERADCGSPAIGACMVCGKTVCIGHALVSPEHIICLGCAYTAKQALPSIPKPPTGDPYQAQRPPWEAPPSSPFGFVDKPEEDDLRRTHLATLGLDESADAAAVKDAYRKLAQKHHPDRAKGERQRKARERKLKELNAAYQWLTQHGRRAA